MSTVTGRQSEFETIDLEAIRDAFREHADRQQAEAERILHEHGADVAETERTLHEHGADVAEAEKTLHDREVSVAEAETTLDERDVSVPEAAKKDLTDSEREDDVPAAPDPIYLEAVINQLSKKYEDKHRMSMELSADVFSAIGKAKTSARQEHEDAARQVEDASAVVEDATRKLKIIEKRYEKARKEELLVKRELQSLPYVAEAAITEARKDIERERDELAGLERDLPRVEQLEVTARAEALTALKATLEPETYAAEKKKELDAAEKLRDLTDYLLTVAKKSQNKENLEAEYAAARREAAIRNAAYSEAYREFARAQNLLEDARLFAREKRSIYDAAHKDTVRTRRKIDKFKDLIDAEENKVSSMVKASAKYDKIFAEYQVRKKARLVRGRQLDAAREEYDRLLSVLADKKSRAEDAADRMYRAEKISVRDVIETNVKDPDFLYLNRYGALLAKAQADEQAALGKLRRALKKSEAV